MTEPKIKYLDQTRYPKLVNPLEKQFKDNNTHITKEMLKALVDKMILFTKK